MKYPEKVKRRPDPDLRYPDEMERWPDPDMRYPDEVERRPDIIAAVRYPNKIEHRPDRIAAVRHPGGMSENFHPGGMSDVARHKGAICMCKGERATWHFLGRIPHLALALQAFIQILISTIIKATCVNGTECNIVNYK